MTRRLVPTGEGKHTGHEAHADCAPALTTTDPEITTTQRLATAAHARRVGPWRSDHVTSGGMNAWTATTLTTPRNNVAAIRCSATVNGALLAKTVTAPRTILSTMTPTATRDGPRRCEARAFRRTLRASKMIKTVTIEAKKRCDSSIIG